MTGYAPKMSREQVEQAIAIHRAMGLTRGDPSHCGCFLTVEGRGGAKSHRRFCRRPVSVVDLSDQGWCKKHATPDNTSICDACHRSAEQGCICLDLIHYGFSPDALR